MTETTLGPVLGLLAFAGLVVAVDWLWGLLRRGADWYVSRDARTARRRARTLDALGRIHDRSRA